MKAEYENERLRKKGKKYIPRPHFDVEPTWIDWLILRLVSSIHVPTVLFAAIPRLPDECNV